MSKLFKIYILFLFLMIINISSVNAENTVISNSTCRSNSFGTVGHQDYARWNDGCSNGENSFVNEGMAQCAIDNAHFNGLPTRKVFRKISDDNKYVHVIIYDIGRIDAWSDRNGIWEENSSFGRPSCQGMDITYISTSDISDYLLDTNNVDGLELLSVQKTNLNDTFNGSSVYEDYEKYFLESWRANIYDISGGTLTGDKFSYNVSVTSLGTNGGPNGLGFNGTTQDRYSRGSRAYHYYIPFRVEFRYINDYNKCVYPTPEDARQYAYDNPNTCCYEFPQTCCGNADFMNSHFSITDWRFAACCEDSTVKEINDTKIYAYYTFKYYMQPGNYFNQEINNLYDKFCKSDSCRWDVPSDDENHCCKTDTFKNMPICNPDDGDDDPGDTPPPSTNTPRNCTNKDYFNNNKEYCCGNPDSQFFQNNSTVCCEATEGSQSNTSDWQEVCTGTVIPDEEDIIRYINSDNRNSFSCYSDTNYSNETEVYNNDGLIVTEGIQIKPENEGMNIEIESGQGFGYKLNITDTITVERSSYTQTNNFSSSYNMQTYLDEIAALNDEFDSIVEKYSGNNGQNLLNNMKNNQEIKFIAPNNNTVIYDNDSINLTNLTIEQSNVQTHTWTVRYEEQTCNYDGSCWTNSGTGTARLKVSQTFKIQYSIDLPMAYISLSSENVKYEKTEGYVSAGRKIYTKTTDPSAYYRFYITVTNGGFGGFSDKINIAKEDGYTCYFKVNNCINEGTCIDEEEPDTIIPSDGTSDYYFRPISLTDPFPNNRLPGNNWNKNSNIDTNKTLVERYITDKGDSSITANPQYSIRLTSEMINEIQNYNNNQKNESNGYMDWETMNSDIDRSNNEEEYDNYVRTSRFLDCLSGDTNVCTNIGLANLNWGLEINQDRGTRNGDF